jgi:hypothetical protein
MTQNANTGPDFIAWYRKVFGFSDCVATALNDDQLFQDKATIAEFGDSKINSVCRTLRRDSSLPIAELAVTRLKLLTFWIRHQDRTGREIGVTAKPLVRTTLATLNSLKEQKKLEDGWAANKKGPEYTAFALNLASATEAFEKVKTILTRIRGMLGVPLVYVIQDLIIPEEEENDPAFGEDNSKFNSRNHKTITRCPILVEDCDYDLSYDKLEVQGPFVPTFLTDSKKVWAILHVLFSTSGVWEHVKKFTAVQDFPKHVGSFRCSTDFLMRRSVRSDIRFCKKIMSLVYAKKSGEIGCVLRVFLHVTVARGTKILMWRNIKNRVAMLVRESTYLRSSHGSRRRSVQGTCYARASEILITKVHKIFYLGFRRIFK